MEITIIGAVTIILSIIALVKNEEGLIYLTVVLSIFTAAMAININTTTTVILPYQIPALLWIIKQVINFFKSKTKLSFKLIKNTLKENKILTALIIFSLILILSSLFMFITGKQVIYTDIHNQEHIAKFSKSNISQPVFIIFIFVFVGMISLKIKTREEIKKILKVFTISSFIAVIWGIIQFILYYCNISYPAFLFNNNIYAYQGYNQVIRGIQRVSSIGTEPSVFALNLLALIPILYINWIYSENKKDNIKSKIVLIVSIICAFLTTSSTIFVGLFLLFVLSVIYIVFNKKNELQNKKKASLIFKTFGIIFISAVIAGALIMGGLIINNIKSEKNVEVQINTISEEKDITKEKTISTEKVEDEYKNFFATILELTLKKLQTGSGQERLKTELVGLSIFKQSPIFGVGLGTYRTFNLFVNILTNLGLLGILAYMYILFITIKSILKYKTKDKKYSLMFLLVIIFMNIAFLISIPDLIYVYYWLIIVLAYKYSTLPKEVIVDIENDRKKIGIDARGLDGNRTGISTYIAEIINQINNFENDKNEYILYSNRKINLDIKLKDNIFIKECNKPIGTFWLYFILPKLLKQDNIDVFWGTQHCLPQRNKYTKNIKYVLTVHDLAIHKLKYVGELKNTIIQRIFLGKSCRNADSIMADSEATKKDIEEIFKIDEKKIYVVYLGTNFTDKYSLNQDEEQEIFKKFNVEDKNYLFFVSTIEPRKNIITLVKAFEKLKEQGNKELKLILAGGLGWKYENILEAINNSKYKADINLPGYISKQEKECLLHNTKCFVYPSLYEGFGLPILEAMANEAIVVTSHISSIPEVGKDVAIYFYNVHDYNELAEIINKALNMESVEKANRIKAGKELTKEFTWRKCAKEVKKIL